VVTEAYLQKDQDFKAVLTKIKGANPDVITFDESHNPIKSAVVIELKDGKQVFRDKINP
jgi:branched-chain amino acid transport system substrate-binding protein